MVLGVCFQDVAQADDIGTDQMPRSQETSIYTDLFCQFEGRTDFLFTMEEIKDLIGEKVSNHELYVHASVYDWYLQLNETGRFRQLLGNYPVHKQRGIG